ncbi:MAG: hypothetical protein WCO95_03040 [Actinomycetes bacterium]
MNNADIFRPRSNVIFAGIGLVLSGLFVWSSFYQSSGVSQITSALIALTVIICVYIFLIRPKVLFCDEGVVITNPLEEFTVGWNDVIQMDTRWALTIETKEFTVSAWAATATGRPRRSIHHTEIKGLDIDQGGSIRTADSPHYDSGAAAHRARVRIKRFQSSGQFQSLTTSRKRQPQLLLAALFSLVAAIATNFLGH